MIKQVAVLLVSNLAEPCDTGAFRRRPANLIGSALISAVEANGIWIESQEFTDCMVPFVPFHSIEFIVGSIQSALVVRGCFRLGREWLTEVVSYVTNVFEENPE